MVNVILIRKLLADLREKRLLLKGKKIKDVKMLKEDAFLSNAVQHMMEIMVEISVDIGNHIIADEKWPTPSSNREIFEILEQNGVISSDVMDRCKRMVGFRNIVVHMYEKVDLEEVYIIYKRHLNDFEKFAGEIEVWISK